VNSAEEVAALKAATREAHEAIKDLRAAIREGKELVREIDAAAETSVTERVHKVVQEGLDEFGKALEKSIEGATEAVFERFDTLADLLNGADKASKRQGKPTISELIEEKVRRDRQQG
jgi:uncharacterized protein YukE